jgi:hypothetical protein
VLRDGIQKVNNLRTNHPTQQEAPLVQTYEMIYGRDNSRVITMQANRVIYGGVVSVPLH